MRKSGWARAPGSAGELVQGNLSDGKKFIISLPVDLWSRASITLDSRLGKIMINDPQKVEAQRAARCLLDLMGQKELGGVLEIKSDIPVGKGMASSTADITATCLAIADVFDIPLTSEEISGIARQIGPADGVMYAGLVAYDPVHNELIEKLGPIPALQILMIDVGGVVDKLELDQQPKMYKPDELNRLELAYRLVRDGLNQGDFRQLGLAGIISARQNQRFLFKSGLPELISIAQKYGAFGLCVGHSSTIVCLLFDGLGSESRKSMFLKTLVPNLTCRTIQWWGYPGMKQMLFAPG